MLSPQDNGSPSFSSCYYCRFRRPRCASVSTLVLRSLWAASLSPKCTSFSSSRTKTCGRRAVGYKTKTQLKQLIAKCRITWFCVFVFGYWEQVQRSGDHRVGVNKFHPPAPSISQVPLTVSGNPLPTSSSATQSMTSLSRFAPSTAAVAVCTISGSNSAVSTAAAVQSNGDLDSKNLS